jgi:hypothetical protein
MTVSIEAIRAVAREERGRAVEIIEACDEAGQPALAEKFIRSDFTVSEVRRELATPSQGKTVSTVLPPRAPRHSAGPALSDMLFISMGISPPVESGFDLGAIEAVLAEKKRGSTLQ